MMKSVDVIIPLYNGAPWIRETLDSVLAQTLKPNKIIVVDDESTDNSVKLVYNRPEILLLHNPGKGADMARNYALEYSDAEFVAFLDHDDLWHLEHLRFLVNALSQYPEAHAAISKMVYFENNSPKFDISDLTFNLWDPWQSYPSPAEQHTTSSMIFRSSKFRESGGWAARHSGNTDYFAWYRISLNNPVIKGNAVTLAYRKLEDGMMSHLRKDILQLILSFNAAADELMEIFLKENTSRSRERYVRRRNIFYHTFYMFIISLFHNQDASFPGYIKVLEKNLSMEKPHFKNLFKSDLEYMFYVLGNIQMYPRNVYLDKLIKYCPSSAVEFKRILLIILDEAPSELRYYLNCYLHRPWSVSLLNSALRAFKKKLELATII